LKNKDFIGKQMYQVGRFSNSKIFNPTGKRVYRIAVLENSEGRSHSKERSAFFSYVQKGDRLVTY